MSKFKSVLGGVLGMLGLGSQPKINIPEAVIPAQPAPVVRQDTGANVVIGSDAVANQRVSGMIATGKKSSTGVDPLGGLGRSGLSI